MHDVLGEIKSVCRENSNLVKYEQVTINLNPYNINPNLRIKSAKQPLDHCNNQSNFTGEDVKN